MDEEIRRHMEDGSGNPVGVCSFRSGGRSMHLLFGPAVLLAAVSVQEACGRIYIKNADTTGYGLGHTRRFVAAVVRTLGAGVLCCFSRPRHEYIFHRSSMNGAKNARSAGSLLEFWISVFEQCYEEVHVWSNSHENRSHPFEDIGDVVCFDDDPKERLARHFRGDLHGFFETLLCRADFSDGSLVYGVDRRRRSRFGDLDARDVDIGRIEAFLRSQDFGSLDCARESTSRFVDAFGIEIECFRSRGMTAQRQDDVQILGVRRKHIGG